MTSTRTAIRTCRIEDVPAVLDLWQQARSGHATTVDRPADVERLIRYSPGALLLAEHDRGVSGALIAAWDGWRGNLYRLAVHPAHRRSGIGRTLVRAGEEQLRRQGATRVTALVAYEDLVAAAFWDSVGYPQDRQIGRRVRNL